MSLYKISEMISTGQLKGEELVWSKGWEKWIPLRDVEIFSAVFEKLNSQEPTASVLDEEEERAPLEKNALDSSTAPKAWMRFWARFLDYTWYLLILGFLVSLFAPHEVLLQHFAQSPGAQILVNVFVFLLFVPIEAYMLARFGKTPGKAFLGIRMQSELGGLPTFKQALYRSLTVCIRGVFFWIPIVSIFVMMLSRFRLIQMGQTIWDEEAKTFLVQENVPSWRIGGLIFIVILLLVLFVYSSFMTQQLLEQWSTSEQKN